MQRELFDADHENYREVVREFVQREVEPNLERWDDERLIDRETWHAAAAHGLFGLAVPEVYGGSGVDDFRFRCVVMEEFAAVNATSLANGFTVQDDGLSSAHLRQSPRSRRSFNVVDYPCCLEKVQAQGLLLRWTNVDRPWDSRF